jgi:hypothetical protein
MAQDEILQNGGLPFEEEKSPVPDGIPLSVDPL